MEFLTYKKFYEKHRAETLAGLLKENGVEFKLTEDRESLDSFIIGDRYFNRYFFVKIRKEDFAKVDSLLSNESRKELETVDEGHYLYEFTNEELFDILSKPDEWNEFDYQLSKQILSERSKEINNDTIDLLKKQRIKELARPEEGQKNWIYAGYLFSLLGGLLGIFLGWHLSTFKKTLPNGERIYGYSKNDRRHGTRIFIIGIVMFILWVSIRVTLKDS